LRFYGCICHDMMNPEQIEYTLRSYPRFPRYWYYPKFRLATWYPTGVLTDAVADQIIEFIEMQEHDQDELFDRYTDFSGLTKVRLKVNHMFEIARRRRSAREPVNSAFFADQPVTFSIAKMYEGLMERAMITVRVFEKRETAAEWLGVPLQILYPPSKKK
jgi:hypothetical protein